VLPPGAVYEAIRQHIEAIVWSLFYWQEGEVVFQIGNFEESGLMRIQVPMRRVILGGIKRAPNAKTLVARLGKKEAVFHPTYETEDLIEIGLTSEEFALLRLVDGQRSLYEVCTGGPFSASDNAKLMYAFQVLQMVRQRPQRDVNQPIPFPSGAARDAAPTPPEQGARPGTGKIKIQLKTAWDHDDGP